jgi:hypothetical protein
MIERLYNRLWEDEAEVRTAANAVLAMNAGERTKAAIRCVNRKYQREMETSVRRGMASPAEIHERLSVLMAQEIEDLLMGFGEHTEGISRFRLRNAATDQLLYEKAEKLVRAELQHFYKNMILPTTTPLELMEMKLDALRESIVVPSSVFSVTVPHPPRGRRSVAALHEGISQEASAKDPGCSKRSGVIESSQ